MADARCADDEADDDDKDEAVGVNEPDKEPGIAPTRCDVDNEDDEVDVDKDDDGGNV